MKLVFRGWGREVKPHAHTVTSVQDIGGTYKAKTAGEPLTWNGPFNALGKVNNLALSGSFLIEFTFDEREIGNWLSEYVKAKPASALRLLATAQAEAVIALNAPRVQPPHE